MLALGELSLCGVFHVKHLHEIFQLLWVCNIILNDVDL